MKLEIGTFQIPADFSFQHFHQRDICQTSPSRCINQGPGRATAATVQLAHPA